MSCLLDGLAMTDYQTECEKCFDKLSDLESRLAKMGAVVDVVREVTKPHDCHCHMQAGVPCRLCQALASLDAHEEEGKMQESRDRMATETALAFIKRTELEAIRKRVEELVAALEKYGRHGEFCINKAVIGQRFNCDCGLTAAMKDPS